MKKKLNLDLQIRKLTKAIVKGEYAMCSTGRKPGCVCGRKVLA